LPLTFVKQRNFVADFLQLRIAIFYGNRPSCVFEAPFGKLRGTVRWLSQAHWKARSGLPISIT